MNLNDAYEVYVKDPDGGREVLGAALIAFVKRMSHRYVDDPNAGKASGDSSSDAVGDGLLRVWENLSKYDPNRGAFTTWVTTILRNEVNRGYRKHHNRAEVLFTEEVIAQQSHRSMTDKLTLKHLIELLNEEDKLFTQWKLEGYSEEEIAAYFKKNVKWVKNKWQKLQSQLRGMYASH
jgi:RNA polymerase sigma factor (sigma-70 family)